jgi:hypothetical protein
VWTSRTLSAFQTFPRNIIRSPLTFMNGSDSSDDLRYLADGSRTTSISPIWLQVRLYRKFGVQFTQFAVTVEYSPVYEQPPCSSKVIVLYIHKATALQYRLTFRHRASYI